MITDGLTETAAPDGTQLGLSATRSTLARLAPLHRNHPNTHAKGTPPTDDRSVLVVVAG